MNRSQLDKVSPGLWVSSASTMIQLIVAVCTVAWIVSQVSATTGQLQQSIGNLTHTVEKLNDKLASIQSRQFDHEARINVIERDRS